MSSHFVASLNELKKITLIYFILFYFICSEIELFSKKFSENNF